MEDYTIISVIPGNPLSPFVPVISEEVNLGSQPIQSLCFLQSALKNNHFSGFHGCEPEDREQWGKEEAT